MSNPISMFRVVDASMTALNAAEEHSFPPGTVLLADSRQPVVPGCFVIAQPAKTKQVTFKRLTYDGGRWYLRPLNPNFKTVEIDDPELRVIGRVTEYQRGGTL